MKKGFTLIEILIVIFVVGILIANILPRVRGIFHKANDMARTAYITQIATAMAVNFELGSAYPSTSMCSSQLMTLLAGRITQTIEDPSPTKVSVDECVGEYKWIPFSDTNGGILITEVESVKNATFQYIGGSSTMTSLDAVSSVCLKGSCGTAPWYNAIILKE